MHEAARQTRAWQLARPEAANLSVGVNVSARQLQMGDVAEETFAVLRDTGLAPAHLILEITETTVLDTSDSTSAQLAALRSMGVRLALDDFGTGYSSLAYLCRFPVDALKIDRSFIAGLDEPGTQSLVQAILQLGRTLDIATVAEGAEAPGSLDALRELGCVYAQGYAIAPPLSPDEAELFLLSGRRVPASASEPIELPATPAQG
jgi:EAL domain-containing protein (putative c-di-GMP-specific phosphodiesterase class I)